MSDELLNTAISIGMEAEKLLSNTLLSSIFFSVKNHACESFMATGNDDDKKRYELWQKVQGVRTVEAELQALIDSGNMAKDELKAQSAKPSASVHSPFSE